MNSSNRDLPLVKQFQQLENYLGNKNKNLAVVLLQVLLKNGAFDGTKPAIRDPFLANIFSSWLSDVNRGQPHVDRSLYQFPVRKHFSNCLRTMEQSEAAEKYFCVMNELIRRGSHDHSKRKVLLSITYSDEKAEQPDPNHRWDRLPSVVMNEIFSHLTHKDRINSATVCSNWQQSFSHPCFWKKIRFVLSNSEETSMAIKNAKRYGRSVEYVTVECHTPCSGFKLNQLLEQLCANRMLKQLVIEPTLATVMAIINFEPCINPILRSIQQIIQSSKELKVFTLGFIEELIAFSDIFVNLLANYHGQHLIQLGLASVKRDREIRQQAKVCRFTFERFESIECLSIDYDHLNDAVLMSLTSGRLKRLVVHVHEPLEGHPGTSDIAWQAFTEKNKHCKLHLIFVRAYTTINVAHETILKRQMPLTYFKALYCESSNVPLLRQLVIWYGQTLESIIWVDSTGGHTLRPCTDDEGNHDVLEDFYRCPNFKEMIYIGQSCRNIQPDVPVLYVCPVPRDGLMHCQYAVRRTSDGFLDASFVQETILRMIDYNSNNIAWQEFYKLVYDALGRNSKEMMLRLLLRDTK